MSRISNAFKDKAFIGFLTAGDPSIEKTEEFIGRMTEAGADLIEIGIPFSDPIAEGAVIQQADIRSLRAGTKTEDVFNLVEKVRYKHDIPIAFMTYLNPVFKYGADRFFKRCKEIGADGIIIPDMPFEEKDEIKHEAKANGIDIISLIAPTSEERIMHICKEAEGFIYVVSSMGVTGMRSEINTDVEGIIKTIRKYTGVPAAVGFGINTPRQAAEFSRISDGVIVGSAIVNIIAEHGDNAGDYIYRYVKAMKEACVNGV